MKKRRVVAALMACAMVVASVAGCSSSSSSSSSSSTTAAAAEAAEEEEEVVEMETGAAEANTAAEDWSDYIVDGKTVIRVGIDNDPGTLDPYQTGSSNGKNSSTSPTIFQTLAKIQGVGGDLGPEIASSWATDDYLTYDIDIYDNVYDSAGNHITADDVVFSFVTAKESGNVNNMNYVESIEKTGDYSVSLTLTEAAVTLFERIMQGPSIVSEKAYTESEDNFAVDPIATGPYTLVEWTSGSSLVIEKNENFWMTPEQAALDYYATTNVDRIEFSIIKEAAQTSIALETGLIDLVYNLDAIEAQRFMEGGESSEGFNVFTSLNNLTQTLILNCSDESILGDDLALRQAILYAIDVDALIDGASDGYGVACKTWGCDELGDFQEQWKDEEYYEYDPDKAMELIAESNYNGETLRIVGNNSDLRSKIAQIVQAYLLQVGINAEIMTYDDTLFNTYKNDATEWDILLDNKGTSDLLIGMWRNNMNNKVNNYGAANCVNDPVLEEKLQAAANPATNGPDTINDLHQYMKDNAYIYGMYNQLSFSVGTDVVLEAEYTNTPWLMPAACTYVWN